jgi:hypothetical protein
MSDLIGPIQIGRKHTNASETAEFEVTATTSLAGEVTIRVIPRGSSVRSFTVRADNLVVDRPTKTVTQRGGVPVTLEWKARATANAPWVAVVIPDGNVSGRREVLAPM